MIRFAVILLALAFTLQPVIAKSPEKALQLTHEWQVSLDATGRVTTLKDDGDLNTAVRTPLEQAIRSWTFEPGRINDRPVPTETVLTLNMTFVPSTDDKYSIHIDDARTGGVISIAESRKNPPRLPKDAARPGLLARVVVRANYDALGKIVGVEPQPDQGFNSTKSLEAATVNAVRKWTVNPERVDGHGVASSVLVPICYTVTVGYPSKLSCAWTPPGSRSKIDNGGSYALAPTATLQTDVIGSTTL